MKSIVLYLSALPGRHFVDVLDEVVGQLKQLVKIDDPLGRLSSEDVEGVAEVHRL